MSTIATQSKTLRGYGKSEAGVLPTGWGVNRLGDCGEVVMGQSPPGVSYNLVSVGSPLINGPTEFTDLHPVKIQWTTQPMRLCRPGDLLICVRGSSTGRTNYADEEYAIGRGVAAVRAKSRNDTQFLSYQVLSGVSDILAAATGSTFPSVDGSSNRDIQILLPPLSEQREIAEALSDVDRLLGALEALIAKKQAIKHATLQQLLSRKTRLPGFKEEWTKKAFGVVASIRDQKVQPSDVDAGTPCVELDHIGQGSGQLLGYAEARFSMSTKFRFYCGDVLFGRLRVVSRFLSWDAHAI